MIMPQKAQIQIALLDTPVTHEKQSHPEPQEIDCFNPDEIRETNVKFPSLCNLPGPAFPLYLLLGMDWTKSNWIQIQLDFDTWILLDLILVGYGHPVTLDPIELDSVG